MSGSPEGPGGTNPVDPGTPEGTPVSLNVPEQFSLGEVWVYQPAAKSLTLRVNGTDGEIVFTGTPEFQATGLALDMGGSTCKGTLKAGESCQFKFDASYSQETTSIGYLVFGVQGKPNYEVMVSTQFANPIAITGLPPIHWGNPVSIDLASYMVELTGPGTVLGTPTFGYFTEEGIDNGFNTPTLVNGVFSFNANYQHVGEELKAHIQVFSNHPSGNRAYMVTVPFEVLDN